MHVMNPFARPFRTIPRRHSTSRVADDMNSHIGVHIYEFVCDQSTNTNSYLRLGTPPIYHILEKCTAKLYVGTWSCLHVSPSLAYYGESYFAQHSLLYEYFPQGKMIVHISDAIGSSLMV